MTHTSYVSCFRPPTKTYSDGTLFRDSDVLS
jgi:hypothetical protein